VCPENRDMREDRELPGEKEALKDREVREGRELW
jgi:hypothetical protein